MRDYRDYRKKEKPIVDGPVFLYAELSRKQYDLVQTGGASIEVPYGVKIRNRTGSRCLFFDCDDLESSKELKDGLDNSGIGWQEV